MFVRILIAEDDPVSRRLLEVTLCGWGHDVVVTGDGDAAWEVLGRPDAPRLAVLDWMMPGLDGPTLCRKVRAEPGAAPTYLILLTARESKEDVVAGLASGANDYVTKPFDRNELQARIQVGVRVLELEQSLANRVRELEAALAQVKQLRNLLPICSYCKSIRRDDTYWQELDHYLVDHSDLRFSHGICPTCFDKVVQPQLDEACRARAY
jgi:phosphoserine phosphatase RsbU/P